MEIDGKAAAATVSMEVDNVEDNKGVSEDAAAAKNKKAAPVKPSVGVSGLPQSQEELEYLIKTIHQTVNDSVLPRLQKCLTAKVRTASG